MARPVSRSGPEAVEERSTTEIEEMEEMHGNSEAREEALKAMSDGGRKQPVIIVMDGNISRAMLMHAKELIQQSGIEAKFEAREEFESEGVSLAGVLDVLAGIYLDRVLDGLVDKLCEDVEAESRRRRYLQPYADAHPRKAWQTCHGPAQRHRMGMVRRGRGN